MPDVLVEYGVVMLFAWAFAVQAGVPAAAVPILVGAGVLSGSPAYDPAGNSQSLYPPAAAAAQADTIASVTVRVPADARLWFENTPTTTAGGIRITRMRAETVVSAGMQFKARG